MLKEWTPSFRMEECDPEVIHVWVQYPTLDLQFWSYNGLCKLSSAIGKPIMADFLTATHDKLS